MKVNILRAETGIHPSTGKFYEMILMDCSELSSSYILARRYGKADVRKEGGALIFESYSSHILANREYGKIISEKVNKGYSFVNGATTDFSSLSRDDRTDKNGILNHYRKTSGIFRLADLLNISDDAGPPPPSSSKTVGPPPTPIVRPSGWGAW